ncbi:HRDC domain-containing protein [Desulfitobacterium sp.]|uniref:HRDC domain-containing protein n=1 Tax=Desulfitobacterium sp. TaxID=49981 RepID=UPI002B214584|nr:HRDC domain-containing protein [Desulfitobacterium sp.]MEA4903140.1 NERD domain-containing protein [Desulfitobacterium sp.]
MPFFDHLKEAITQKPVLNKPIFIKADNDAKLQLEELENFLKTAPDNIKPQIELDIKLLSYGIVGEDNVAFELNNSYIPMLILHDLNIEYDGLSAQIDYLIITKKVNLIIECKNLFGNIEVNSSGDFIRTVEFNGKYKKEGIYSPITQNTRHLEMIKKVRFSTKNNILTKTFFEKYFYDNYKSVVVLANPKTIINLRFAKKEIREQIIRSDQLIEYIKKKMSERKDELSTEKQMFELAEFFLSLHKPKKIDFSEKYSINKIEEKRVSEPAHARVNIGETPLYKALRQYRYETSQVENIKPYFIYNNAQMEELISVVPKTLDDIKKVSGFGDIKCNKYGNAILEIIKKFS